MLDRKRKIDLIKLQILGTYASMGIPPELAEADILMTKRAVEGSMAKEAAARDWIPGPGSLINLLGLLGLGAGAMVGMAHSKARQATNAQMMKRLNDLAAIDLIHETVEKMEELKRIKEKKSKRRRRGGEKIQSTGEMFTVV